MIDRNITISNLDTNIRWIEDNPSHQFPGWGNVTMAMLDAMELLKEQEAVEPEVEVLNEIDRLYRCPKCHKCFFYEKQKYCDQCGQEVKWK